MRSHRNAYIVDGARRMGTTLYAKKSEKQNICAQLQSELIWSKINFIFVKGSTSIKALGHRARNETLTKDAMSLYYCLA